MSESGQAPDLSVDEFEAAEQRRFSGGNRHPNRWWLALVVAILIAFAALIVFDHRHQPCRFEQYSVGGGSLIEQCAPN